VTRKHPFCHSYTSFGAWPKDHGMPLHRSTTGVCHALLRFPPQAPLVVLRFPPHAPLAPCGLGESPCQFPLLRASTQPLVFLISKQVAPYRTCGGTYCPGVSTPKIRSLADSSTTCYDGINHLHHSNHCSNHNIDPHMVKSHLDGWKTTTLSQRHKPNSTSQRMEDLYDTQHCMTKLN
jgi:hypothetical protein